MPLYHYEARDRAGQTVIGTMQVPDPAALTRRLTAMGYTPTTIQASGTRAPAGAGAAPSIVEPAAAGPRGIDHRTLSFLYRQLAVSFRAGIAPYQAFSRLAASCPQRPLAEALSGLAAQVERGGSVAGAMAAYPGLFTPGAAGLVRAAELGGFLDRAFVLLADRAEEDDAIQRAVRPWLWYLALVIFAALFFAIPVAAFMRPAIAGGLNAGLRAYGHALLTRSLPMMLGVMAVALGLRAAAASPALRERWDALLLRLPILGRLARLRTGATVAETLATLYHGGVAPVAAWQAAAEAAPNAALAARLRAALPIVRQGGAYSQAMRASRLFNEPEIQMVATGETSGDVEEMLDKVAEYYRLETGAALRQIPATARGLVFLLAGVITLAAVYIGGRGYVEGIIHGVDDYFNAP
jgi:type II secretory pathway component PulF